MEEIMVRPLLRQLSLPEQSQPNLCNEYKSNLKSFISAKNDGTYMPVDQKNHIRK